MARMHVRMTKEAHSQINEELQEAQESYFTVFPVKFTIDAIVEQIHLLLI